jgi:hypothetical protein
VKLRELLTRIGLRPLSGEGERPIDNVDALASAGSPGHANTAQGDVAAMAPPNWVPSQQDERPRH